MARNGSRPPPDGTADRAPSPSTTAGPSWRPGRLAVVARLGGTAAGSDRGERRPGRLGRGGGPAGAPALRPGRRRRPAGGGGPSSRPRGPRSRRDRSRRAWRSGRGSVRRPGRRWRRDRPAGRRDRAPRIPSSLLLAGRWLLRRGSVRLRARADRCGDPGRARPADEVPEPVGQAGALGRRDLDGRDRRVRPERTIALIARLDELVERARLEQLQLGNDRRLEPGGRGRADPPARRPRAPRR